jgi:glycosyltransferase involved in cell wall biosynthesis
MEESHPSPAAPSCKLSDFRAFSIANQLFPSNIASETRYMPERRICVICHDFYEIGGVGLAGKFASIVVDRLIKKNDVDVLVTNFDRNTINSGSKYIDNAHVEFLSEISSPEIRGNDPVSVSLKVYRHIRDSNYDSVHIFLPGGAGAHCAMAKRQGLIGSEIITYVIGGSEVKRKINNRFPDKDDFLIEALERAQWENSDFIASVDQSNPPVLVGDRDGAICNIRRLFWNFGSDYRYGDNCITNRLSKNSIYNIFIFGNSDYSSGIDIILQALRRLPDGFHPNLTFIGDFSEFLGENSGGYIIRSLAQYCGEISFLPSQDDLKVAEVLRSPNSLTVIPGRGRDCSWELAHAFSAGSPFLAFGVDGMSDHVAAESLPLCTAVADPDSIVEAIVKAAALGMPPIRAAYSAQDIESGWQAVLTLGRQHDVAAEVQNRPLVSVCLTHYERPALLQRALKAIALQTYPNIEVIIVDDGSKSDNSLHFLNKLEKKEYRFSLKIVRSRNIYLGAARNLAASYAKGEYILFHDDDNISEPNEIDVFVRAAIKSDADILTCLYWVFEDIGGEASLNGKSLLCHAVGVGGPISLVENRFGDANALVRRRVFEEIGGFSTLYGVGYEDWEFFLKAYLRGYRISLVPEPLFNYRISSDSMVATGSHNAGLERVFRLLGEERCAFAGDLARFMSREMSARHSAEQLSKSLESSKARSLHLQLAEMPPNAAGVWAHLSRIAEMEGRADDPAKLVSAQSRSPSDDAIGAKGFGRTVHVELLPGSARPAAILVGWGVSAEGEPISPRYFRLDGRVYEVCAIARHPRLDVNERFKIPHSIPAGFCIAGRLVKGARSWPYRLSSGGRVGSSIGKIRFFGQGNDDVVAHVDQRFLAHEAHISPPQDWSGTLTVETARASFPFVRYSDNEYRLGVQKSPMQTEFVITDKRPLTEPISAILPMTPKADVFFRTQQLPEEPA